MPAVSRRHSPHSLPAQPNKQMKKLDKFILKSFIGPFFAILFIVIFILMMQFLWLYIDELVGKGLGLKVILEFMFWGGCTILPLALPLATLLSSMMIMGQLAENNELLAIKSAGVGLARILVPLEVTALMICVAAFFSSNNLVPHAYNEIFTLRDDIGRTKEEIKIPEGTFYDGIEGYVLRVDRTSEETGMMYGIMVYDHANHHGNTALTLADSASMVMSKNKDYLTFTLFNGINYTEDNTYNYRDTILNLSSIEFDRQELVISLRNYAFEKSDSTRFGDQIKTKGISVLGYELDSLQRQKDIIHDDQLSMVITSSSLIKGSQLDSSHFNKGIQAASYDDFMVWNDPAKEEEGYRQARDRVKDFISTIDSYSRESYENTFFYRRTDIEILKRFAGALACLLMFFIGAPVGSLIRKGGLGTPAIISALFFVLYWVVDISGTKLSNDGAIKATTGAFLSAYVLGPIGAFLTWKAIKDSSLSLDNFKTWWRRMISMVTRLFRKTRIVFMGTPEFAVASLDALIRKGYKVVGVVTVADKPSGRGLKVNESAVKRYAVEHGIPVLQPVKMKDPTFLEQLSAWKADLFVVVAFRMLPEEVWAMPKLGTFNLHAALLPQYRGAAPINWAVINGEQITGVTTFMIDKDIDTGGIIFRQEHRISRTDTAGDVHDALMVKGAELVTETVEAIIQKNVETRVQRSFIQGSEVLKPAPKLTRELCHIDWDDTSRNIYNLIRGLSPYPTAFTEIQRDGGAPQQLKIFSATMAEDDSGAAPGTILTDGKTYLAVRTADGRIDLEDIQLAGKKRMKVHDFLLGFRDADSYSLTKGTSKQECRKTRS